MKSKAENKLAPDYSEAYLNLSTEYFDSGDYANSIDAARKTLEFDPDNARAYHHIGRGLRSLNDYQGSISHYERALELDPAYVSAYSGIAATYFELKNLTAVSANCMKAIKLDPTHATGFFQLGMACQEQGNLGAAETFMLHSAALDETDYATHWNLSLLMLAMGKLEQGWNGYEARWKLQKALSIEFQHFPYPYWEGEALPDKTLLIWWERDIFDQVMFVSLLDDVMARVKKCIISCPKKLMPLLVRSYPKAHFICREEPQQLAAVLSEIDVQCPLGSLARWLRPTVASFPRKPYLVPQAGRVAYWKKKLAELGPGLKVGLNWRSGNLEGDLRCAQIGQWQSVLSVPGVHFVNLQIDASASELGQAKQLTGAPVHAYPEVDLAADLDEAAALTKALDLVIAVPTMAANLAAASGVQSWMITSGFAWQKFGTEESCWYPAVRHFDRKWDKRWEDFLPAVARELYREASKEVSRRGMAQ